MCRLWSILALTRAEVCQWLHSLRWVDYSLSASIGRVDYSPALKCLAKDVLLSLLHWVTRLLSSAKYPLPDTSFRCSMLNAQSSRALTTLAVQAIMRVSCDDRVTSLFIAQMKIRLRPLRTITHRMSGPCASSEQDLGTLIMSKAVSQPCMKPTDTVGDC